MSCHASWSTKVDCRRFEALAKQLGIPAARVAQTFNMAQRNIEDKFRRSVMRKLANDETRQ
jgi:hypothetical protein